MVIYNDSLWVFGGKDEDNEKLNDLWEFNLKTGHWTEVAVINAPMARSGHSANLHKDFMIIFGGIFEVTQEKSDMHIFDLKNHKWILFFNDNTQTNAPIRQEPPASPAKPPGSPRFKNQNSFVRGNSPSRVATQKSGLMLNKADGHSNAGDDTRHGSPDATARGMRSGITSPNKSFRSRR
jgi:hypothetical protein